MTLPLPIVRSRKTGFRWKLTLAMMLVVLGVTALAIYLAESNLASEVSTSLRREFEGKLTSLHSMQQVRHAALVERSRALVRKPRIHAALEDNALDLLYPSARDELRDILSDLRPAADPLSSALNAEFYRFLGANGRVLSPPDIRDLGYISPDDEARLSLRTLPKTLQLGYVSRAPSENGTPSTVEILAVPIISTETGEPIASLVLGFNPLQFAAPTNHLKSGIWLNDSFYSSSVPTASFQSLAGAIRTAIALTNSTRNSFRVSLESVPHLAFFNLLNPDSLYPAAYEICLFPLSDLLLRQQRLRGQILSIAALMLLVGFIASHYFSGKLSVPVEQLAVDSERQKAGRERAEAALEQTSVELQRSARFSADASHQLKTPVTVMRAGLEELLARDDLSPDLRREIDNLVHQSFRLTGVVDDLLLLSRMDAGRLNLDIGRVDLSLLLASELDDLTAQPNSLEITITSDLPPDLVIEGEKRYTSMIVRNLLENARKYNRPNGSIHLSVRPDRDGVLLTIANSGPPIPAQVQERIFERFHRGAVGENVPGHGLGLNLARELARLHGGDLWLVRSHSDRTEFAVRFRLAPILVGV